MDSHDLNHLLNQWTSAGKHPKHNCPDCSEILVSIQDPPLVLLNRLEKRLETGNGALYSCPQCGSFFQYTTWLSEPSWGEAMEGITEAYEVSCLYRRTKSQICAWLAGHQVEGSSEF